MAIFCVYVSLTMDKEKFRGLIGLLLWALQDLKAYTYKISEKEIIDNKLLFDACMMKLQVVGELTNKLYKQFPKISDVEYQKIIGLRNLISHDYFGIDKFEIALILKKRVSKLYETLRKHYDSL